MRSTSLAGVLVAALLAAGCLVEIEKAGRGILIEVEEEGGDRVRVWLR